MFSINSVRYRPGPAPAPPPDVFDITWNPAIVTGQTLNPGTTVNRQVVAVLTGTKNGTAAAFAAASGSYYFAAPQWDGPPNSGGGSIAGVYIVDTASIHNVGDVVGAGEIVGLTNVGTFSLLRCTAGGRNNEGYLIVNTGGPGVGGLADPTTEYVTVIPY